MNEKEMADAWEAPKKKRKTAKEKAKEAAHKEYLEILESIEDYKKNKPQSESEKEDYRYKKQMARRYQYENGMLSEKEVRKIKQKKKARIKKQKKEAEAAYQKIVQERNAFWKEQEENEIRQKQNKIREEQDRIKAERNAIEREERQLNEQRTKEEKRIKDLNHEADRFISQLVRDCKNLEKTMIEIVSKGSTNRDMVTASKAALKEMMDINWQLSFDANRRK